MSHSQLDENAAEIEQQERTRREAYCRTWPHSGARGSHGMRVDECMTSEGHWRVPWPEGMRV